MSSTDDSVINARSHLNPNRVSTSPRKYSKRIGYGATTRAKNKAHLVSSRGSKTKTDRLLTTKDMAVKNESSLKGNVKRKLPSESSNCDSADGSCCCGICFSSSGEKWRRPARRGCVVFIVFLALLLDSLLLTCMGKMVR